jgi:hypothetical protein
MFQVLFSACLESFGRGQEEHGLDSMPFGLAVQKFLNIEWFFHWKKYI